MSTAFLTMRVEEAEVLFALEHPVTVGSSADCNVRVKTAAPRHAQVSWTPEGYFVRDLTGQGLVRVNGRVVARQELKDGDVIKVGSEELCFSLDDAVTLVVEPPVAAPRPMPRRRISASPISQVKAPAAASTRKPVLWGFIGGAAAVLAIIVAVAASSGSSAPAIAKGATSPAPAAKSPIAETPAEVRIPAPAPPPPVARDAPRELPVPPVAPLRETPILVVPAPTSVAPSFAPAELASLLRDPTRRSSTAERSRMAEAIRSSRPEGHVVQALGVFLSQPESSWPMALPARHLWAAYLRECPLEDLSLMKAEEHVLQAKRLLEGGSTPALRLVALAHLLDAGAGVFPGQFGFRQSPDGKIWGDGDAILHYRLSRADPSLDGLSGSSSFAVRYASMLQLIRRTMDRGAGFEAAYSELSVHAGSGTPRNAEAHLKALRLSFRTAVRCKECKDGRILCTGCEGKTRVDLPCPVCKGRGRVQASGAVDGANVSVKCRNCEGRKIFKDVGCPACSRSGSLICTACAGRPWRDAGCAAAACRKGWVPCTGCGKRGKVDAPCPDCNGTGRVAAPGAVDGARVTQKCRTCNENHGVFRLAARCPTCEGNSWVRCDSCKGKRGEQKVSVPLSEVLTTEPCRDCSGAGWPWAPLPAACPTCIGLGYRVKPAADPSKVLD
jgi:DnaJ-class molecular chaperone